VNGDELWRSDGTAAGTFMVKDINVTAADVGSAPQSLTAVGDTLFFAANDGLVGSELWKSDGTAAGTVLVMDINPGPADSRPGVSNQGIQDTTVSANGMLFFMANDGVHGIELWKSDGTAAGTVLVKDINPGAANSNVSNLTAAGSLVYFTATDATLDLELWVSDGTAAGTTVLKDLSPGVTSGVPSGLAFIDGVLYFQARDGVTGNELWKTDGTAAGTVQVTDLMPGSSGGLVGIAPTLVIPGEPFVFPATNGLSGLEVWRSDGTAAGTQLVQDIAPGPRNSNPSALVIAGDKVFFAATDLVHSRELWAMPRSAFDTHPPAVTCPADPTLEATGPAGALVTYPPASVTDNYSAPAAITLLYSLSSGGIFPIGVTPVTVSATDEGGNTATCAFNVAVVDTTPPAVTCPSDQTAEATSGAGAAVSYPAATASDTVSSATLSYSAGAGSTFPLGGTPVTATATDAAGNAATCTFTVTVRDTTAPALTCPADQAAEASSGAGAAVSYPAATATDAVSSASLAYSVGAGSTFPLGNTSVTATATDTAGNAATCTFSVTVRDTTAPAITCPANQTTEATSGTGAAVSYPAAMATDMVSSATLTYSTGAGSTFPLGGTPVTATAIDTAGNAATCTFTVTVRDTTPPAITCPADQTAEASSGAGAVVSYPAATASDAVSSATLTYSAGAGSAFPLGNTPVAVTATDAAGNAAICTFTVTVRDTTPPVITCPANQQAVTRSPDGATVAYPDATATDTVTTPTLSYSQAAGTVFPIGDTLVTATAADAATNSSSCVFTVTVTRASGCGCQASGSEASLWALLAAGVFVARRRRRG
jgi:MYXO-CTERM domain-containing protein